MAQLPRVTIGQETNIEQFNAVIDSNNQTVIIADNANAKSDTAIDIANTAYSTSQEAKQIAENKENSFTKNTAFNKTFETNTSNIKMDGTVSVGISQNIARADHIHPSDTTRATVTDLTSEISTRTYEDIKLQNNINLKSPINNPTFTGIVTLPSTTSIGEVSNVEISHLNGVTSSIQTQLNTKLGISNLLSGKNIYLTKIDNNVIINAIAAIEPIISKIYDELKTLKTNNLLVPGQKYILSNYQTIYNRLGGSAIIKTSQIEPLILTASNVNAFEPIAYSIVYPQDKITYSFDNIADYDGIREIGLFTDSTTVSKSREKLKGIINRRYDTIKNIDYSYDWRTIVWRNIETLTFKNLNTIYGIKSGIMCYNNTYESNCYNCTCGNNCYNWTCGISCYNWTCGNGCYNWTCLNGCYNWTCGNNCYNWTCGNSCNSWTCLNSCNSWTCGNSCSNWTCGNYCNSWTCGNYCNSWTCGNYCNSWNVGNDSYNWNVGNDSYNWNVGNDSSNWSCGNNCIFWQTGKTLSTLIPYFNYVTISNGISGNNPSEPLKIINSSLFNSNQTKIIVFDNFDGNVFWYFYNGGFNFGNSISIGD